MCELIFLNSERSKVDPVANPRRLTWGMAVAAMLDDWDWNETERGDAYFIIKLPKIPRDHVDVQRLLEEKRGLARGKLLARRNFVVQLDKIIDSDLEFFQDGSEPWSRRLARLYKYAIAVNNGR